MDLKDNIIANHKGVFVIAEAGVNHNGDLDLAKKLVDIAAEAKADAVKFQTFKPGECTGKFAFKVAYQEQSTDEAESRFELSNRLALPFKAFTAIKEYCEGKGIMFLSTPDGKASLDFLVDGLNVAMIKISSTEITNTEFLKMIALKNKPIILSTGMSNLEEVKQAVEVIKAHNKRELTLLHCTTEYPAPHQEVNLKAMVTLQNEFGLPVGYSDHTEGNETAVAAVALGAKILEKHITFDKALAGPDHQASLAPAELKDYVRSIRIAEKILGDGVKKASISEIKNIPGVRRGLVAAKPLNKGTILSRAMLTSKRPNTGIQPSEIDQVVGKRLNRDLEEDEVLMWEYLQ